LVENPSILVESHDALDPPQLVDSGWAERAAQIADIADVDEIVVRVRTEDRPSESQLGLGEDDVGDLARRPVPEQRVQVAAYPRQVQTELAQETKLGLTVAIGNDLHAPHSPWRIDIVGTGSEANYSLAGFPCRGNYSLAGFPCRGNYSLAGFP